MALTFAAVFLWLVRLAAEAYERVFRGVTANDVIGTVDRAVADDHPHLRRDRLGDDRVQRQLNDISFVPGRGHQHVWPVASFHFLRGHASGAGNRLRSAHEHAPRRVSPSGGRWYSTRDKGTPPREITCHSRIISPGLGPTESTHSSGTLPGTTRRPTAVSTRSFSPRSHRAPARARPHRAPASPYASAKRGTAVVLDAEPLPLAQHRLSDPRPASASSHPRSHTQAHSGRPVRAWRYA